MSPSTSLAFPAAVVLACVVSASSPVAAQPSEEEAGPLHVALVEGEASLTRNGEVFALADGTPLIEGDRVRTGAGRAELRATDGSRAFLDRQSTVDVVGEDVVRLAVGSLRLSVLVTLTGQGARFRVETPAGVVHVREPGEYRVDVRDEAEGLVTEVSVSAGVADLATGGGTVTVRGGERTVAGGFGAPAAAEPDSTPADAFDRWVDALVGTSVPTASAAYLPPAIASYGATLDQYGSWAYEPSYGYVWYPTVAVGWRPFHFGSWWLAGRYGYVWVGQGPWGWPTHHYGRWGHGHRGWYWRPSPVWGPAWVSWSVGPGYVGWCPLGWNNEPVYGFGFGFSTGYGGGYSRPPRHGYGWTVLPAQHFRHGVVAARHAVDPRTLSSATRSAFVAQRVPPRTRTVSGASRWPTGRGQAGTMSILGAPTSRASVDGSRRAAVPRGTSPVASGTLPSRDRGTGEAATRRSSTPPAREGVPRAGETAAGSARPVRSAGASSAVPRWVPPPVHYGVPRAEDPLSRPAERTRDDTGYRVSPGGQERSRALPPGPRGVGRGDANAPLAPQPSYGRAPQSREPRALGRGAQGSPSPGHVAQPRSGSDRAAGPGRAGGGVSPAHRPAGPRGSSPRPR